MLLGVKAMNRSVYLSLFAALFLAAACGDDSGSGKHDASTGNPDAGVRDAAIDAPMVDSAIPDAARPDASPLAPGAACGGDAGVCGVGYGCCAPCCTSTTAVCTKLGDNDAGIGIGQCPLPDLALDRARLVSELGIGNDDFSDQGCSVMESCVSGPGLRRLLHFTVSSPNIGTSDLVFGNPANHPGLFQYSMCHDHFHFSGYALYRLLDQSGTPVLEGRKRAFCLEDFERQDNPPLGGRTRALYTCDNQGISMGWTDSYVNGLTCQFMDVTDLPPGDYTLEVTINPDHIFPELRYDNNQATAPVHIGPASTLQTDACFGQVEGTARECGWTSGGTFTCTPGTTVTAGCGSACGVGSCTGDPILRICAGDQPCRQRQAITENDDCNGATHCAGARFTCPAGGQYNVLWAPFVTTDAATCNVSHTP